ncbi:hypothetical protein RZS08_11620 [Arthrospira platensis SPKY1]|nr:hypothetical protein [Arthrospira platensis SPKY1]
MIDLLDDHGQTLRDEMQIMRKLRGEIVSFREKLTPPRFALFSFMRKIIGIKLW